MELIEVDPVGPQGPEGGDELGLDVLRPEAVGPVHEAIEAVTELGGDDPAVALVPREIVADQALGQVVAVTLGRVDEVDAGFGGPVEDGVDLGLFEGLPPFASELPSADADDGDFQAGPAQCAVFHLALRSFAILVAGRGGRQGTEGGNAG